MNFISFYFTFNVYCDICIFFVCPGSEVAQFVAKKLPDALKNTESYQKGEIKQSMIDCFLEVDQLIISDKVCKLSVM